MARLFLPLLVPYFKSKILLGEIMKKIIVGVFLLVCIQARADYVVVVDECLAAGDVELTMSRMIPSVTGRIGTTEIRLQYLGNTILGHIQGLETRLKIRGNRVVGKAGINNISWTYNNQTAEITGFQKCLLGTITIQE